MFTLTRRADAETEAFIRAIHRSAYCADACCTPLAPPTVELPRIVATTAASEPAVLESTEARTLLALVGMLVVLAACLAGGLMNAHAPAPVVVDYGFDAPERVAELGGRALAADGAR